MHKALGLFKPSFALCKICDCPSNKYAEHISTYHNIFSYIFYRSTTRSGMIFGFSFSDLTLNCCNVVMLGEWMYCFFCAKATSLPRFENQRPAKNGPTFAAGKSGEQVFEVHFLMTMLLVSKVKFAPRHHEEVCFCLWQRNASEKASTPPNSHSLFFSGCSNPLRFTCFWCVPQRC